MQAAREARQAENQAIREAKQAENKAAREAQQAINKAAREAQQAENKAARQAARQAENEAKKTAQPVDELEMYQLALKLHQTLNLGTFDDCVSTVRLNGLNEVASVEALLKAKNEN
jgi:hypothetical protein